MKDVVGVPWASVQHNIRFLMAVSSHKDRAEGTNTSELLMFTPIIFGHPADLVPVPWLP